MFEHPPQRQLYNYSYSSSNNLRYGTQTTKKNYTGIVDGDQTTYRLHIHRDISLDVIASIIADGDHTYGRYAHA